MKKLLLSFSALALSFGVAAQINVTQADYGQAGDSIVVGYDDAPPANLNVGGSGMQTWDFTSLSLSNINTLNFVDPATTISGSEFPNADLAIERLSDTLFFRSSAAQFEIDGFAGAAFGLPVSIVADFNPNSTQIEFPSTYQDAFVDTAIFDTTVSCAEYGFGSTCDSARLKRILVGSSDIDAYGTVKTPGGNFQVIRQYFMESNTDTIWAKVPLFGWTLFLDSTSTEHNYRWIANGEKWPVLSVRADAQGGNIEVAEYVVGAQVLGFADSENDPSCNGGCDGSASVYAVGGVPPYNYAWPGGQTTASVSGLCAGTYNVTITDNDTGQYEATVELIDPSPISIAGAVQGVNASGDGAIDISVSGGAVGYSFSWTGPDGFTAVTEDISGLEVGDYTVEVTDSKGCDTSRTFNVDVTGITSIVEGGFRAYPNPANDMVTILSGNQIQRYRITDLLGNTVMKDMPLSDKVEVSTVDFAAGIYLIEVETIRGTYLGKVTVRH